MIVPPQTTKLQTPTPRTCSGGATPATDNFVPTPELSSAFIGLESLHYIVSHRSDLAKRIILISRSPTATTTLLSCLRPAVRSRICSGLLSVPVISSVTFVLNRAGT